MENKKCAFILGLLLTIIFNAKAQKTAHYYFDEGLAEHTRNYIPLEVVGAEGDFELEVVPKLGRDPRTVYVFPSNSGLMFNNKLMPDFIQGSYAVEMYFRFDNGDLLIYGQLLGSDLDSKQGEFVHLVITRDAASKKVIVYNDGEAVLETVDAQDNLAIEKGNQILFFVQEGQATTSGAVALLRIHDYFIDKEEGKTVFENFSSGNHDTAFDFNSGKSTVLNQLFFVRGGSELKPESIPQLESLASKLEENPEVKIEIQGHTDNQGDPEKNIYLSRERAESVKSFLIKKGIGEERLSTRGFGSARPRASNGSERTRKLNRRVEVMVL
ncbi:OmpA family protein [Jiulongibacter sp. NS-SX5]|uniref:OmpA family protein n=1 Tax=Jiulongibacter sp. NS-SX5 TaxID=3463854 RepID=UPI004058959E